MPKRWTKSEDDYLLAEVAGGSSRWSVANVLGRSYDAVVSRIAYLKKQKEERLRDEHAHGKPKQNQVA